jgi:outer membrane receptor for ferrienterochelin and colicins
MRIVRITICKQIELQSIPLTLHTLKTRRSQIYMKLGTHRAAFISIGVIAAISASDMSVADDMSPMVVTGTRTPVALSDSIVAITVISSDDLDKTGASNVAEALDKSSVVKVSPASGHSPGIEMQGFGSEHVLILINGQRVNGRVNGAIDLRRINTSNIEQIEIVQGPSSALYGSDALGGVVNIITSDEIFETNVRARVSSQGSAELAIQSGHQVTNNVSVSGSVTTAHTASYDLDDEQTGNNGPETDRYALDVNAKWEVDNFAVNASVFHQYQDRLFESSTTGGGEVDVINVIEESRVSIRPSTTRGDLSIEGQLAYARYFDQYVQDVHNTADGDADERTTDQLITLSIQASLPVGQRHSLTAGVENHYESLSSERLADDSDRSRTGVYAQDRIDDFIVNNLQAAIGARYDGDTQFGGKATPKISLSYRLNSQLQLLGGAGTGYRAPDFKQLYLLFTNASAGYVVEGNPDLIPEETESVNIGLGYKSGSWDVQTNAYYHDVENLIETVEVAADTGRRFTYENVSRAQIMGIDSSLGMIVNDELNVSLFYNYLDSENKETGEALSGRAEHRGGVSMTWESGNDYIVSTDVTRTGKRVFTSTLGEPGEANGTADGYTQLGLQVAHQGATWRWALGGKNLFDEGDVDLLTLEPRRFYIELERKF